MGRRSSRTPKKSGRKPSMDRMNEEVKAKTKEDPAPWIARATLLSFYALLLSAVFWSWHRVPEPVSASEDGEGAHFSEERAMGHGYHLSEVIGQRQVGTHGLELAESYVLSECLKIKSLCESLGTCVAEVTEETVSGAFQYNKTGTPLYLSYSGLRNVLRTLRPAETDPHYAGDGGKGADAPRRALLVNSYVDSALSSPGAADCASCVAVGLESARVLALKSQAEGGLRYKVGFLFNGGEEIYMNAVHGFVQARGRAQYLREYAAFVNLEATGSYGPDVVFRANSEVLLGSYVKRAPRPRATVIAQDIFGSGAVPSDTDYSVLGGKISAN